MPKVRYCQYTKKKKTSLAFLYKFSQLLWKISKMILNIYKNIKEAFQIRFFL